MKRMKTQDLVLAAACSLALAGAAVSATAQTSADADGAFAGSSTFAETTGEAMYRNVCAGCHMTAGEGAVGAGFYPALANNPKLVARGYPLYVLMKGLNGMPPLGEQMSDQQVADVINYVRTNFGNHYTDAVQPADVAAMR